jgi:hypothetical protein
VVQRRTSNGSSRSTTTIPASRLDEFEFELAALTAGGSRLARAHRGVTTRDKAEANWTRHRAAREMETYLQRRGRAKGPPE